MLEAWNAGVKGPCCQTDLRQNGSARALSPMTLSCDLPLPQPHSPHLHGKEQPESEGHSGDYWQSHPDSRALRREAVRAQSRPAEKGVLCCLKVLVPGWVPVELSSLWQQATQTCGILSSEGIYWKAVGWLVHSMDGKLKTIAPPSTELS